MVRCLFSLSAPIIFWSVFFGISSEAAATGTISLSKTLRSILSDTSLVKNLENAEYRSILLDGKATLEERFAKVEAQAVIDKLYAEKNQNEKMQLEMKQVIRLPDLSGRLAKLLAARQY